MPVEMLPLRAIKNKIHASGHKPGKRDKSLHLATLNSSKVLQSTLLFHSIDIDRIDIQSLIILEVIYPQVPLRIPCYDC